MLPTGFKRVLSGQTVGTEIGGPWITLVAPMFTSGSSPNDKLAAPASEPEKRGGNMASQHRRHRQAFVTAASILACASLVPAAGATRATVQPPSWTLHGRYSPTIDPRNFVTGIHNRYFPLKPGTGFHYRGFKGAAAQTDDMIVTNRVKRVLGV